MEIKPGLIQIKQIVSGKKRFLDLLLLGDEQETMLDRYLERGELFALYEGDLKAVGVVTDEGDGVLELKNIAVYPVYQRKGYGKRLIEYLLEYYRPGGRFMLAGTGDVPATLAFYQSCGFVFSHRVPHFFTDYYDHPIWENGVQLVYMVYLKKVF